MSEFKLEHGKRYVTRDGQVTDGVVWDRRQIGYVGENPFTGVIAGLSYVWSVCGKHNFSESNDLLREYVPPPEPQWVPFSVSDGQLFVGRTVRSKSWPPGQCVCIGSNNSSGVTWVGVGGPVHESYESALRVLEFADGTPFGKQVPQ